jgi:hypothetical protein
VKGPRINNNNNNQQEKIMNRFPEEHLTPGLITRTATEVTHTPWPRDDETDTTMPKLIEALGGQAAFEALPVLDLGTCAASGGGTGYIDFVRADDMSAPIMRGEDEAGRPFVAFRIESARRGGPYVETLFRRYTAGPVWTSGGGRELCTCTVDDDVLSVIADLSSTGTAEYTYWETTKSVSLS